MCGWMKWKRVSCILYNKMIMLRLDGKLYKAVVRPINITTTCMDWNIDQWTIKRNIR